MPTRNVNLTEELDEYVAEKVASGRYASASEAVRALEREEREAEAKLAILHAALEEGERSGIAPDGVFERVRKRAKLPSTR